MPITGLITGITVAGNNAPAQLIDTVLVKVASRCNIDCTYCYVYNLGDDNYLRLDKFMSEKTISALCASLGLLASVQEELFSVVLHGGEPLLLGSKKLCQFLAQLRKALPASYPVSIQTNGILLSDELLDICSAFRVTVAVSIDGPKGVHDRLRKGHQGQDTFDMVMKGINILKAHRDALFLNAGVLAVIDPESDPILVYNFFKELAAPSVDFLYKDGNHDRLPMGKSALDSMEYGRWLAGLLDVYLSDPFPMPIRVLDDMLKVFLGGMVSKEGMGVTDFGILIVDTDGTIMKNDTLKSAYNGADLFEKPINVAGGNLLEFLESDQFKNYREDQRPTSATCLSCAHLGICGGGMTLHRYSRQNGFNNPSVYCADQIYLIGHMKAALTLLTVINEE
ncbi:MAG: cyclophane-forming radical SAM/SPASM peptide maturase YhhB [Sphingobacteriales bacterium]